MICYLKAERDLRNIPRKTHPVMFIKQFHTGFFHIYRQMIRLHQPDHLPYFLINERTELLLQHLRRHRTQKASHRLLPGIYLHQVLFGITLRNSNYALLHLRQLRIVSRMGSLFLHTDHILRHSFSKIRNK